MGSKFTFPVLRQRPFAAMYTGTSLSLLTDGIIPVAFALEAIHRFGSASALTVVLISLWSARFICTLPAGALAARADSITIMIAADVARISAQLGLVVFILVRGENEMIAMAGSAAIYGAATAFYGPASIRLVPEIVEPSHLKEANSLFSLAMDVAAVAGPAMAGVLTIAIGFEWILVLDSATFLLNIIGLLLCRVFAGPRRREVEATTGQETSSTGMSLVEIVRQHRWLSPALALWFLISVTIGLVAVAGPAIVIEQSGSAGWAMLATVMSIGSLFGTLGSLLLNYRWGIAALILSLLMAAQGLALAWFSAADSGTSSFVVLSIAFFLGPLAVTSSGIIWTTILQVRLDRQSLARFSSVEGFVNSAGVPVGMILGGVLLSLGSDAEALTVFAVCVVVGGLLVCKTTPLHVSQEELENVGTT